MQKYIIKKQADLEKFEEKVVTFVQMSAEDFRYSDKRLFEGKPMKVIKKKRFYFQFAKNEDFQDYLTATGKKRELHLNQFFMHHNSNSPLVIER